MRTFILVSAIMAMGMFTSSLAATVQIYEGTKQINNVNDYTYITTDYGNLWTIDSLLKENRFAKSITTENNIGFSRHGRWLSFTVENKTGSRIDFVYSLNMSVINHIKFYETSSGKITRAVETGEIHPAFTRDIQHRRFAFSIDIPQGESRTYYLYLFNDGDSMYLPFSLKDRELFYEKDFYDSMLMGFYFGVLLFIIIFNIFYVITLRETYYTYYTLYLVFASLFIMNIEGVSARLFPQALAPLSDIFTVFFVGVLVFSLLSFNTSFFAKSISSKYYKLIYQSLKYIALFGMAGSLLPYPYYVVAVFSVLALTPISFIFLVASSYGMYRRSIESAQYFLLAYTIGGLGVIVYVLRDLAVLPDNIFTEHTMKITLLAESVIFFFAIMQRIRNSRIKAHNELVAQKELLRKQQEELKSKNAELEKLSIVARETDNSVAIYSADGIMEWVNEGFYRNFSGIGKKTPNNISKAYPGQEISEMLNIAAALKESVVFETEIKKNPSNKWLYTTLTPIIGKNGNIERMVAIDSDITDLKNTQDELVKARDSAEQANKLKTAFLSNVSHELRTPLNSIIGFSQLLLIKDFTESKRTNFLKLINDNGNHLLNLISDIIDISKIESGYMQVQLTKINLNNTIGELYEQFHMQTKNTGKEFEIIKHCPLKDEEAFFETDIVKLRQVLLNLIGNSIKFTQQGHIMFGYRAINTGIELFVEDTGIGLTPEEIEIVFHRFRQADDSITRKYGGTGLGLTISKGLIELLGGKLIVESEKNKGTKISFSFPFSAEARAAAAAAAARPGMLAKLEGKKVLVVEDDDTNFDYLDEVLNENNAIVYQASTAAMAIDIVEEVQLDIILLDIQLPDINGYRLAEIIREKRPDIPIIAQTAYAYEDAKQRCIKSGCSDYISKPIDYQLLLSKIDALI
jgi:signal transduction histidine kinase/CheY-like chemotaxis protein